MHIQLARARREAGRQTRDQSRHQDTQERGRAKPGFDPRDDGRQERAYKANRQAEESQQAEDLHKQEQEAIDRLNRQKSDIEAELHRKKVEAEEEIRKQAEALRHREEALRQEQARAYMEQMHRQEATEKAEQKPELDPAKIQDAYSILGVVPGSPLSDYRKVWTQLVQQYHPDKTAHLGEKLQKVALVETQRLNKAFETIEKSL